MAPIISLTEPSSYAGNQLDKIIYAGVCNLNEIDNYEKMLLQLKKSCVVFRAIVTWLERNGVKDIPDIGQRALAVLEKCHITLGGDPGLNEFCANMIRSAMTDVNTAIGMASILAEHLSKLNSGGEENLPK